MGCFSTSTIIDPKRIVVSKNINNNKNIVNNLYYDPSAMVDDKKVEEKKLLINLHILKKNIEAKNININLFNEKIEKIFKELLEKNEKIEKEDITERISNLFIDSLKPINSKNKTDIKNIMDTLYENHSNTNEFKEYLIDLLDDINDYKNLGEENEEKINNYLIKRLSSNEKIINRKEQLKNIYKKNNYIIKYADFTKIVKDNNIKMDNSAIEYLLYKMKCGLSLDGDIYLDNLNFKIFIDYLDKIKEENVLKSINSIKDISIDNNNNERIGIKLKSQNF